jgi:hypothetical protein
VPWPEQTAFTPLQSRQARGHSRFNRLVSAPVQRLPREGLEAGDLKQPSGNGGAALKSASLLPDIKEHIAQKIPLGHGLGADEPEQPTKESSYPSRSAEDA